MVKICPDNMVEECLLQMSEAKPKAAPNGGSDEEEEDFISEVIGEFGRWQFTLTFLLSLFNIPCTWHIFAPTFHATERDTWCARPPQFQDVAPSLWKNCTQPTVGEICWVHYIDTMPADGDICAAAAEASLRQCKAWEFDGSGETIISEWSLVCDRKSLVSLAELMFLGGVAMGGLASGALSDRYGRKRTLMVSVLAQTILGTGIAFAPWFSMYTVLRAMLGFVSVSVVFSGFVLAVEVVGGKWRTVSGIGYMLPVSFGYIAMAGLGWLLRDWRQLQLAISLPGFLFLGLWWVIPESPRWLLALGRTEEVARVLRAAARANGLPPPVDLDKRLAPETAAAAPDGAAPEAGGVLDLFRTREMRRRTAVLFLIWFSVYLVYYGLVLNLGNIGGNLYVNSVLIGAVEVPAIALSIVLLLRCGRRWPLALTMLISGVGAAFAAPLPSPESKESIGWIVTTLTMLSKFSISSSNAIMPVFTAELYPTPIRNVGVGAANVSAGVALMLVPYLWNLGAAHHSLPLAVLAAFGILGGLSVLLLPETGRSPLPATLEVPPSAPSSPQRISAQ